VPPGGCIRSLGTACNPEVAGSCATGFCKPTFGSAGVGVCHLNDGPCSSDDQCANPAAVCSGTGQDFQRVTNIFASGDAGGQALVSVGKCVATTATTCVDDGDCAAEHVCTSAGTCGRPEATCRTTADCRGSAVCLREATVAGSDDADADGVADAIDDCRERPNAGQEDGDADGTGDACDRMTCGDGTQTYAETCDDGNRTSGDGCSSTCTLEGATPACGNGRDDDGDGATDAPADPGCASASDTSERAPTLPCDDGLDNDGDYASDLPDDAGCFLPTWSLEDPQCSDGVDNDADGLVDLADPTCGGNAWVHAEKPASCGLLGIEAAALLAALRALRARRGRARPGVGARTRS
jgi:cysteine-rich repeat protein